MGNPNPAGRKLKADPGGRAYRDSDLSLKTNERDVAKNMPLLSEFTNYGDWGAGASRWARMLRGRPIRLRLDCFVNNLEEIQNREPTLKRAVF